MRAEITEARRILAHYGSDLTRELTTLAVAIALAAAVPVVGSIFVWSV